MDFKVVAMPFGKTGIVTVHLGFDGRYAIVADDIGILITKGSESGGESVFDLDPFYRRRDGRCYAPSTPGV